MCQGWSRDIWERGHTGTKQSGSTERLEGLRTGHRPSVMANLDCPVDEVWNLLKDTPLGQGLGGHFQERLTTERRLSPAWASTLCGVIQLQ